MEVSVSSNAAGMHDAFRDTLVVEPVNLLHSDLILEKSRTGAIGVRSLQPDIGRNAQPERIGGGRGEGRTMFRCYRRAYRAWSSSLWMESLSEGPRCPSRGRVVSGREPSHRRYV